MTTSRIYWLLVQVTRQIWFRSALLSVLAVATALIAIAVQHYIPIELSAQIGADSVDDILRIIATSMLAVTIFSVSTMVSALASATSQVTPRAARLLAQDPTSHNALGTFLGAFLYSLVGIIALHTGVYGETGRVVLFGVTILVILLIVVTLLRWIDHISHLGRMADTTERVEEAALKALCARRCHPHLGGCPVPDLASERPAESWSLETGRIGYVQHIDMEALDKHACEAGLTVRILATPGAFTDPTRPLACITGHCEEKIRDRLSDAFTVGDARSFDQDPRFGLAVLSEIAQRALSPALNDPGTAIDVIGRQLRLLAEWLRPDGVEPEPPKFSRVQVPALLADDLFDDAFAAIARDGAAVVEVGLRLQKALLALARIGGPATVPVAIRHSQLALLRARQAACVEQDWQSLAEVSARIDALTSPDPTAMAG